MTSHWRLFVLAPSASPKHRSAGASTSSTSSPPHRLIRLVGAALANQHDDWAESRRYLGLDVASKSRAGPHPVNRTGGHPRGTDRLTHHNGEPYDDDVHQVTGLDRLQRTTETDQ